MAHVTTIIVCYKKLESKTKDVGDELVDSGSRLFFFPLRLNKVPTGRGEKRGQQNTILRPLFLLCFPFSGDYRPRSEDRCAREKVVKIVSLVLPSVSRRS